MSYVEHGPRVFLTGRSSAGMPLTYGGHVLPRKRSEGRLKLQESCSDIRAWSPNALENTRYFRELAEHAPTKGKTIPINVIIENIIGRTSQAQNELHLVRKELQKYKGLKLTPEQEEQLRNLGNATENRHKIKIENDCSTPLSEDGLSSVDGSVSSMYSDSYLSILIRPKSEFQNNKNLLCSYTLNSVFDADLLSNSHSLLPTIKSLHDTSITEDYNEKSVPCVEYADVGLQVENDRREVGVQFEGQINAYILNKVTIASAASQTSLLYQSSDEESSVIKKEGTTLRSKLERRNSGYNFSSSQSTTDSDNSSESESEMKIESDLEICESTHKDVIIEKDSEIIALKNELCVKEAELEEQRELNRNLESVLQEMGESQKTLQENLKLTNDSFIRLDRQRNYESEDCKKKLSTYKCLVEQLKEDLNKSSRAFYLQSQEIEKLQLCGKDAAALRMENDFLLKKVKDMAELSKEAECSALAVRQLKDALRENDELKTENREQSCILADQEDEIKRLLILINQMSVTHEQQARTEKVVDELKATIRAKNLTISRYESRVCFMKKEVCDFFDNLKDCLNTLDEFNETDDDTNYRAKRDLDIRQEANNVLHNVSLVLTRFQNYKIERQSLLERIEALEQFTRDGIRNLVNEHQDPSYTDSDQYFDYESEVEREVSAKSDSVVVLSIEQNNRFSSIEANTNTSEIQLGDLSDFVNSEKSLEVLARNSKTSIPEKITHECYENSRANDRVDEIEKEIVRQVSLSLIQMRSLMQELQAYVEIERPSLIKQMQYFYDLTRDTQSAISCSGDATSKKQQISDLCSRYREEYKDIRHFTSYLYEIGVKARECIEAILYRQLEDVVRIETLSLQDKKVDQALKIHLSFCIAKINSTLRRIVTSAKDQRSDVMKEVAKQQRELQRKDIEISRLKDEIAQHIAKRGEGDCINEAEVEKRNRMEEELLRLQKELRESEEKLATYDKELNSLRKQNKNLENLKNRLSEECEKNDEELKLRNKEVAQISQELRDILKTKDVLSTMENKLLSLQNENDQLRDEVFRANETISRQNNDAADLKTSMDKNQSILIRKIAEYNTMLEERNSEVAELKNEKEFLNDRLKSLESKIVQMNSVILSLTEENDKIGAIRALQDDLGKLDKSEKKLKIELNDLRKQYANDQKSCRKMESKLDDFVSENENLREAVEYWKAENSELSSKLFKEIAEDKSRKILHTVPNQIYGKLSTLKQQLIVQSELSYDHFHCEEDPLTLKAERQQNEVLNEKEKMGNVEINKILEGMFHSVSKENFGNKMLRNMNSDKSKSLVNISKIMYILKCLEEENARKQDEIRKLLRDVEDRDTEIKSLKETINRITQEKSNLCTILKCQLAEYQDKLTLMKRNYDSSLNALSERHRESVERLQTRFEDTVTDERNSFDSESWLQSLNAKQLMKLHERVCIFDSCVAARNNKHSVYLSEENEYFDENVIPKQDSSVSVNNKRLRTSQNDVHQNVDGLGKSMCFEQEVQDKIDAPNRLLKTRNEDQGSDHVPSQLRNQQSNMKHGFEFSEGEDQHKEPKNKINRPEKPVKNVNLDKQRWNFINQCSMYHKLSNIY